MQGPSLRKRKFSAREAAAILGVSKSWLDKKRVLGGGPPFFRFGRRVVYDERDIEKWAAMTRHAEPS
jgi:predicted DNA-binding transcriptional regulator AlpA